MKALFVIFALILSSAFAHAYDEVPEGNLSVQYDSWCSGDAIKTYDEDGGVYTAFDCYDANKRCVENARKSQDIAIITATCK